jgi:hypothetical protein
MDKREAVPRSLDDFWDSLFFIGLLRLAGKTPVISRNLSLKKQITGKNTFNPRQLPYFLIQLSPLAGEIPFIHSVAV